MTNKLNKKDLAQVQIMSWGYQAFAFNYETMQSPGFVLSIAPCLEKLYGDQPELLKEKINKYFQFYNTNPLLNPLITGVILSIEETGVEGNTDTALALRTGLMGALAGVGDALFWITGRTLFGSIAAYAAMEGSMSGMLFCLLVMAVVALFRIWTFNLGYKQGAKFILENTDKLQNLTDAAVKIGLAVVGCMVPSMVAIQTPLTYTVGETTASLQTFFDTLLPNLIPVTFTAAVYFGLKSKKMTSVRMIWLIIIVCVICSALGILSQVPSFH